MGNKESVDPRNLQRCSLNLNSTFSAQHHIVHFERGHYHGQLPHLDGNQNFPGNQASNVHVQSMKNLNDYNDNEHDSLVEDDLIARGSSIVACNRETRQQPGDSCRFPRDFSYDKKSKTKNDIQGKDLCSSKTVSTTPKRHGKNDNADLVMRRAGRDKAHEEKNQTKMNVAIKAVERNRKELGTSNEMDGNRGKPSKDLQKDLKVIQNVWIWSHGSKGKSTVPIAGQRSDAPKGIRYGKPTNETVPSSVHFAQPPGNLDCHSLFSISQAAFVNDQCNGTQLQNGLSMGETHSVGSNGFTIQCESEVNSVDNDSQIFSSHYHGLSMQKEEKELSECKDINNELFCLDGNRESNIHNISVNSNQHDNLSHSGVNSKREPVESDDLVVSNSNIFRPSYSRENPVSEPVTSPINSSISLEKFQDCFGFCMKDKPFGSPFPSMKSEGFSSGLSSNPQSQSFHNDTGQFDVQMESREMAHSSASSSKSYELWTSALLSKTSGQSMETASFLHSDTSKLNCFSEPSYQTLPSESESLPSVRKENSQDLKNHLGYELSLPQQDGNILENKDKELFSGTKTFTDAANKSEVDDRRKGKNIATGIKALTDKGADVSSNASRNHLVVFPTTFTTAYANSSSSSSFSLPSSSSSPLSLSSSSSSVSSSSSASSSSSTYDANHVFNMIQQSQTKKTACDGMDNNVNVKVQTADVVSCGSRNQEKDKNNNKDMHERPDVNVPNFVVRNHPGHQQISQGRYSEENDADLLADEHVANPRGPQHPRRHGFHVDRDDPEGRAHAFLQPAPDILAVEDRPGNPTFYNAYLLVADADIGDFGLPFLQKLESWNLRIFFRNRDLIVTGYEYENLSAIVEERCNGKVIVVVSKNYPQSPQCQYLTVFAKNLDPDTQKRNIIPVYIDKNIEGLPHVLVGLSTIQYNQVCRRGWLKEKILGALNKPT